MKTISRAAIAVALALVTFVAIHARNASSAQAPNGKQVFTANCAACHQANGKGAGPFPPLAGNPDVTAADTTGIIGTVLNGKTGPITINGKTYSGAMPIWHHKLSTAEIAAVLTYVRSAWGNNAPAISTDQVALVASPVMFSGSQIFAQKCSMCHQPGGVGTAKFPPLAGNPAVNAADPSTIVGIIVNGRSGPLTVGDKTFNGTMPTWKGQLSNADIAAVATYIRSAWGNHASDVTEEQVTAAGATVSTAVGASIYAKNCSACHGADGTGGGGGMFPSLAGDKLVNETDPSGMVSTIKNGRNVMPSWKGQLSDADIAAVVTFIRGAWGNHATPVTATDVSTIK